MTRQASEVVRFQGQDFLCGNYPLEELPGVPSFLAGLRNHCTACRRGYVAHWRIDNNRLLLIDAWKVSFPPDTGESLLPRLIPLVPPSDSGPIPVNWFTGPLVLRQEKSWQPLDDERSLIRFVMWIEAGRLVRINKGSSHPDTTERLPDNAQIPDFLRIQTD